jgi:hypothetical protein
VYHGIEESGERFLDIILIILTAFVGLRACALRAERASSIKYRISLWRSAKNYLSYVVHFLGYSASICLGSDFRLVES